MDFVPTHFNITDEKALKTVHYNMYLFTKNIWA